MLLFTCVEVSQFVELSDISFITTNKLVSQSRMVNNLPYHAKLSWHHLYCSYCTHERNSLIVNLLLRSLSNRDHAIFVSCTKCVYCTNTYAYTHTCTHTYIYIFVCVYVVIYIYICVCVGVCVSHPQNWISFVKILR